jgi:pyruvate carboxylase
MTSVAIYSHEDRFGAHRNKADEAYLVGAGMTPVGAYLAQDDIIRVSRARGDSGRREN